MKKHLDRLSRNLASQAGRRAEPPYVGSPMKSSVPSLPPLEALHRLAGRHGILLEYGDMNGKSRQTPPETLRALLALFGISAEKGRQVREALLEEERRHWRQPLPPIGVTRENKASCLELRRPADALGKRIWCRLRYEEGSVQNLGCKTELKGPRTIAEIDGKRYVSCGLSLPALPPGYHQIELEEDGRLHRCMMISAPNHSYSPPALRPCWGAFLPMYAAHSSGSWGAGNFSDFRRLAAWSTARGARYLLTLPLLASFLDAPVCEPSPYSPASRLFWNEFYLDIEGIPELAKCRRARQFIATSAFRATLRRFRSSPWIDYAAQMLIRRRVLQELSDYFFSIPSARRKEFEAFVTNHPRCVDYAEFRATCDKRRCGWRGWEERMRWGKLQPGDYSQRTRQYYLYTQWLAAQQVQELVADCRKRRIELGLDLPLGVHPDGYDVWRERELFASGASVGAPPDLFFTRGQNWGFAPLHPQRNRLEEYKYLREFWRFQMRHSGLLRLDHIMGLHRLYWIPAGFPPTQGAYVSYPVQEMYALLCLESHRHHTVIVGENLGTVPTEVNQALTRHGLRKIYVLQFEQAPDPNRAVRRPEKQSLVGLNTHDTPLFAAHWRGLDIEARAARGLLTRAEAAQERARRKVLNAALVAFLRKRALLVHRNPGLEEVLQGCLKWLATSPAEFLVVNLEDLWQEERPQNVPGTSAELPNWRRKCRFSLEQIEGSGTIRKLLLALARIRPRSRSCKSREPCETRSST